MLVNAWGTEVDGVGDTVNAFEIRQKGEDEARAADAGSVDYEIPPEAHHA